MKWVVRLLSLIGFFLIGGGSFLGALLAGFACFDVCPPSISGYTAFYTIGCLSPGVVVAGLGWALCLLLLFQEERNWRGSFVLALLPICAIGSMVAVLTHNAGHLFPVDEGGIGRWERSLSWVFIFLLSWPILTFLSTLFLPRDVPIEMPEQRT